MVLSSSQRCSVQRRVTGPACWEADLAPDLASAARAVPVTAPVTAVAAVAASVADCRNWRRSMDSDMSPSSLDYPRRKLLGMNDGKIIAALTLVRGRMDA